MIDAFDLFSLCTPAGPAASTNRVIEISITHRSPPLLSPSLPPSSLSIESEGGRTVVREVGVVGEEWILFSLSLLSSFLSPPPSIHRTMLKNLLNYNYLGEGRTEGQS